MKQMLILFSVAMVFISSCGKTDSLPPTQPDTSTPILSYPVVSFSSTQFFMPFGDTIHSLEANKQYTFDMADTSLMVVSCTDGFVQSVTTLGNGRYLVTAQHKPNSIYQMQYFDLSTCVVEAGDSLNPGTIFGKIDPTGIVNLKVIRNNTEVICPGSIGNAGFNTAVQLAINKHNFFNPTDSIYDACWAQVLPK